jgi:hypothetical protein
MTYEKPLLAQAELRTVRGSTIERKIMSTKTSFKRIALVAVAGLVSGLVSVAPANAALGAITTTLALTDGTTANGKLVVYSAGTPITGTVTLASGTQADAATDVETATITVTGPSLASPTATNVAVAFTTTAAADTAAFDFGATATTLTKTWISGTNGTGAFTVGTVSFTPAIPGIYTVAVVPSGTDSASSAGTVTKSITVGSNSVLVPTVGTSITAVNAAVGQSGGLTAYRFNPSGFTKTSAAVTTYFATVDSGSIDSITNGSASGTTSVATPTSTFVNGVNNSGGMKLILTLAGAGAFNDGGTDDTGIFPAGWVITLNGGTATTQTLTIKQLNNTTGAITTIATAVSTYGAAPAVSTANSTSVISKGTAYLPAVTATDDTVVASKSAAQVAVVKIVLKDQYAALINGQTLSATIAGSGLIAFSQGTPATAGTARSASLVLTSGQSDAYLGISADGTAGVGTITISVGTTVLSTETVKFYGAPATLVATQKLKVASKAGAALGDGTATPAGTSVATTPAVILVAKDANGVVVPGLTITAKSSDTTVMTETITINGDAGTALGNGAGAGSYNVAVTSAANTSGKTATLTFRTLLSDGVTYVSSAPITFALGGAVYTTALALDKAAYTAGETAVANLTVKDSAGNAAFDADHASILLGALTSSLSVVKTLQFNATTASTVSSVGGVSSISFNAPGSTGAWKISGTNADGTAISASATVSSSIETLVNSLIKKINALATLVAKIQKKLGVK